VARDHALDARGPGTWQPVEQGLQVRPAPRDQDGDGDG
jgi:hypothetical protein